MKKATCNLSIVPGTHIIRSDPRGTWEPKYTRQNREDIKKISEKFRGKKWGFMGLVKNMDPIVNADTSKEFSKFHDEFLKKGCVAIAFVVGRKVSIKAQAQRHQDTSSAKDLLVRHFHEEDEALEWLKTFEL